MAKYDNLIVEKRQKIHEKKQYQEAKKDLMWAKAGPRYNFNPLDAPNRAITLGIAVCMFGSSLVPTVEARMPRTTEKKAKSFDNQDTIGGIQKIETSKSRLQQTSSGQKVGLFSYKAQETCPIPGKNIKKAKTKSERNKPILTKLPKQDFSKEFLKKLEDIRGRIPALISSEKEKEIEEVLLDLNSTLQKIDSSHICKKLVDSLGFIDTSLFLHLLREHNLAIEQLEVEEHRSKDSVDYSFNVPRHLLKNEDKFMSDFNYFGFNACHSYFAGPSAKNNQMLKMALFSWDQRCAKRMEFNGQESLKFFDSQKSQELSNLRLKMILPPKKAESQIALGEIIKSLKEFRDGVKKLHQETQQKLQHWDNEVKRWKKAPELYELEKKNIGSPHHSEDGNQTTFSFNKKM